MAMFLAALASMLTVLASGQAPAPALDPRALAYNTTEAVYPLSLVLHGVTGYTNQAEFGAAVAKGIATSLSIDPSRVTVTQMWKVLAGRRLSAAEDIGVKADIQNPLGDMTAAKAAQAQPGMASNINQAAAAAGLPVSVTSVAAPPAPVDPCAPATTPPPASPCGTAAPVITTVTTTPPPVVTTVTTTPGAPASPCGTAAPVITTVTTTPPPAVTTVTTTPAVTVTTTPGATAAPASPCATGAPVVVTVTTTPAATYTTTPGATVTTTPAATVTTTPAATAAPAPASPCATGAPVTAAPASPCGTVAPAAKFAVDQASHSEEKRTSVFQSMTETPMAFGFFGLLIASAAIGIAVRAKKAYTRTSRLTFNGRLVSEEESASDVESAAEALLA